VERKLVDYGSLAIAAILIAIGFLSHDPGILGNLTITATFVVVVPRLMYEYKKYREFKEMEEKFPSFLRDLTEAIRSGMPLPKAVQAVAKLNYGSLSREIRKMANQISWGIPADKVLDMFAQRVKKSKRIYTATRILRESYLSGGDIAAILDSVADSSEMLEEMEKERKSTMNQYVVLMYAISIIFLVIVVAINRFLLPIFKAPATGMGLQNPCGSTTGFSTSVCDLYAFTAKNLFAMDPYGIAAYYTSLFFFMSLIQAIFCGLIAGQISEGSPKAGIRHSIILVGIVFGVFTLMVRFGLLNI